MKLDITRVPFSAPFTFLAISDVIKEKWHRPFKEDGLYLRVARNGSAPTHTGAISRIVPMYNGAPTPFTYEVTPWEMVISADGGTIRIAFDKSGQLRFLGKGLQLSLPLMPGTFEEFLVYDESSTYINCSAHDDKLVFTALSGDIKTVGDQLEAGDTPKFVNCESDEWELMVEEFETVVSPRARLSDFDACVKNARDSFEEYAAKVTEGGPDRYLEAMRQAAYVNYTAQVENEGLLNGRVMLMSKNWMINVWTWDCQFNAVETASYDPEASWDNFASPFTRQHPSGMLLDCVCDRSYIDRYTKPPVHGWALSHLRKAGILSKTQIQWAYDRLLKLVNAWYEYMDWDHDGICQYNHGNDSGWDNCTYFMCGAPIEGPDLSAYLVLCLDELAECAELLGKHTAAAEHRKRADRQLSDLIRHSWDGDHFHTYQSGTHREMDDCDSLLPYLPILLGDRLPKEIFDKMAADLQEEGRFLTPYGLATERVGDRFYVSDGYWRGPIWAPAMMFIVEGLYKGGCKDFARELAERFCANCAKEGFAENFDATSGEGLRDRAYTWTSSVFLIFAKNYLK